MAFAKGNLNAKCSLREDRLIKSWEILASKKRVHEKVVVSVSGAGSWEILDSLAWLGET